jgi:thiosulfate dehydrogenase
MNELLVPLMLITGLGLALLIVNSLRHVEQVNRIIEADKETFTRFPQAKSYLRIAKYFIYIPGLLLFAFLLFKWQSGRSEEKNLKLQIKAKALAQFDTAKIYEAPDPLSIKEENDAKLIQYGRDLIAHTSDYLGPEGSIKPISNGMNCQNCHLAAGSKTFGNNYTAVASTYPKFRARSGSAETIYKRVNDCFQRSLNGQALDSTSREMKAIEAYIKWLGQAVPKGKIPKGSGLMKVNFLNRSANPDSGQLVFMQKCQSCHGTDGQGLPMPEGNGRRYPPLWGEKSYNEAAGLYRLSNFAGYIKANMPLGASYDNPQLTDAEAWDLAAFVNSQPRPKHPYLASDWPKIAGKPFDHPFAPFADSFPEIQHKLGPFQPIIDWQKQNSKK